MTVTDEWRHFYRTALIINGCHRNADPGEPVAVADEANAYGFGNFGLWPQSLHKAYPQAMKG
jgi:hypothetical protein